MKREKVLLTRAELLLTLIAASTLYAQSLARPEGIIRVPEADVSQIVTTADGKIYIGKVTEIKSGTVGFELASVDRDTTFALKDIKKIREVPESDIRKGKYWFPNPNASRIVIAQTGRPVSRGRGSVADFEILLPLVSYAVTDNITLAGGGTFINEIGDFSSFAAFYFLPKIGFNIGRRLALALGGGYIHALGVEEDFTNVGFLYGAATLGKPDASLTLGAGYGFSRNRYWVAGEGHRHDVLWPELPGLMLGGEWRLARQFSLVGENYLIHDGQTYIPVLGYGVRMFGERYSADVILYNFLGYQGLPSIPGIPFIGIVYNF